MSNNNFGNGNNYIQYHLTNSITDPRFQIENEVKLARAKFDEKNKLETMTAGAMNRYVNAYKAALVEGYVNNDQMLEVYNRVLSSSSNNAVLVEKKNAKIAKEDLTKERDDFLESLNPTPAQEETPAQDNTLIAQNIISDIEQGKAPKSISDMVILYDYCCTQKMQAAEETAESESDQPQSDDWFHALAKAKAMITESAEHSAEKRVIKAMCHNFYTILDKNKKNDDLRMN